MAIVILIDGYNLIGSRGGLHGKIERSRETLIAELIRYRQVKGFPLAVIFDGERSGDAHEGGERRGGIEIIYSRHGETADEVIRRMAQRLGNRSVVVSSDREVARAALSAGGVSISVGEFQRRLEAVLAHDQGPPGERDEDDDNRPVEKRGNPRRRSKAERKKRSRLDRL